MHNFAAACQACVLSEWPAMAFAACATVHALANVLRVGKRAKHLFMQFQQFLISPMAPSHFFKWHFCIFLMLLLVALCCSALTCFSANETQNVLWSSPHAWVVGACCKANFLLQLPYPNSPQPNTNTMTCSNSQQKIQNCDGGFIFWSPFTGRAWQAM